MPIWLLAAVLTRLTFPVKKNGAWSVREVVQLFVHQGFVIVLAGVMFGGGLAFATTRLLGAWFFGVGSGDPLSFGGSAVILMVVTLLASYLPTRRAMRVDLIVALRYEELPQYPAVTG